MTVRQYRAHDLVVRSEIALSAPPWDADAPPDVEIRHAGTGSVGEDAPEGRLVAAELDPPYSFFIVETERGFVVRYTRTCELRVAADGSAIDVTVDPRCGDPMAGVILAAGGLAFAAMRQGHKLFHAAGVALDGRAVIALGDPGSGKTTLAAELACAGGTVLADDAIRVDILAAGPVVYPGPRVLRLREASAERLRHHLDRAQPTELTPDGRITARPGGDAPAQAGLAAVFVMCPDERRRHIDFEPLDERRALIEAVRHIRTAGFVDGTYLVDHFSFSSRLVECVPFYRLHRPPRALPPTEVRARVEAVLCG